MAKEKETETQLRQEKAKSNREEERLKLDRRRTELDAANVKSQIGTRGVQDKLALQAMKGQQSRQAAVEKELLSWITDTTMGTEPKTPAEIAAKAQELQAGSDALAAAPKILRAHL